MIRQFCARALLVLEVFALGTACTQPAKPGTTLSSLEVALVAPSVAAGTSTGITATALSSDKSKKDVTTKTTWTSSDQTIAVVACGASACQVNALKTGSVTLTGTYDGKTSSVSLTVTNALLSSLSVSAEATTLAKGTHTTLTASGTFSDGTTQDVSSQVTWTSSDMSVVTVAEGVATGAGLGTATLTATMSGKSATLSLTVSAATMTSLAVSPAPVSLAKGLTRQLTATATFTDASTQDVSSSATWSSSDASIATVSSAGLVTAVAEGQATITALVGSVSGGETVTVTAAVVTGLSIDEATPALYAGHTLALHATGTFSDGSHADATSLATWSSSEETIATVSNGAGTVGTVTGVAAGTTTITAAIGDTSAVVSLTVNAVALTSLAVTAADSTTLALGLQTQLVATGTNNDGTNPDLTSTATWSADDTDVATVSAGVVTAVGEGTANITASVGGVEGSIAVTVGPAQIVSLTVSAPRTRLAVGKSQDLTATAVFTDLTQTHLTTPAVTFTSSDETVATVSASGTVTAQAAGTATITASAGTVSGTLLLTVYVPVLQTITLSDSSISLATGDTHHLSAQGTYDDSSTADLTATVTWTSDNEAAATVSADGVVTAAGEGSANVTATLGSVSASVAVAVGPAAMRGVVVTLGNGPFYVGHAYSLSAQGRWSDGSTSDETSNVTWSSSDETVATVSNDVGSQGRLTVAAAGSVTFTATLGALNGSLQTTTSAVVLQTLTIPEGDVTVVAGDTLQLSVTGTNNDSTTTDLTATVSWASDDGAVVTVSGGLLTAAGEGTAHVTATLGDVWTSITVTVGPAELRGLLVTVAVDGPYYVGHTYQLGASGQWSDGSTSNETADVSWSSSDETVATVSNDPATPGLLTAVAAGDVTFTATKGSFSGNVGLTITAVALQSVAIPQGDQSPAKGDTVQLSARGTNNDGSTVDLTGTATWSSDDESVATVDGGLVTTAAEGTAHITATSGDFSATVTVTVGPAAIRSISVTVEESGPYVAGRGSYQLKATATLSNGETTDVSSSVQWSAEIGAMASVSEDGHASSSRAGSYSFTAVSGIVSGSIRLTFIKVISYFSLYSQTAVLGPGQTAEVSAEKTYSDSSSDHSLEGVTFASSNSGSISVNSSGQVTCDPSVTYATATITASVTDPVTSQLFESSMELWCMGF